MAEPASILVVDDDARIAAALRRALRYEGYDVETAADGAEALARVRARRPDLVVLDVMLPGYDGIEVCRRLRGVDDIPILMLTARDTTADRVHGLDSGADDYLTKPFAYEELLARVRALLRRTRPGATTPLRFKDLALDVGTREVRRGERRVTLTTHEFDLLHHLMRHPRQVLTRDQLLDAAWGTGTVVTANLVDVYIGYLRQKLEAGGEPRLIQTVRGVGYALRDD